MNCFLRRYLRRCIRETDSYQPSRAARAVHEREISGDPGCSWLWTQRRRRVKKVAQGVSPGKDSMNDRERRRRGTNRVRPRASCAAPPGLDMFLPVYPGLTPWSYRGPTGVSFGSVLGHHSAASLAALATRSVPPLDSGNSENVLVQSLDRISQPARSHFRYFPPAHIAGSIHEKLCKAAGIAAVLAAFGKKQVIVADGFGFAIGKKRKREAGLASQCARFLRSVGADGDRENAGIFERAESALDPP